MECPKCHFDNPADSKYCKECGTKVSPPVTETVETPKEELSRGSTFAERYDIIEELGKGGMGRVYRVEDTKLKQEVALKLLRPEIAKEKKTIERFRNELKIARNIRHKNVCGMFDFGEREGSYFITMEYVRGEDLKSLVRKMGQLSAGQAITIIKHICDGLIEAHKGGVVHRDLKPSNIMIDKDGYARIMDFGISRYVKGKGITDAGVMIGTPEYMSPEQVEGKDVDQRTDIYSLGVILYEMVTGRVPFEGDTALTIAVKHKTEEPKDPREFNSQITEDLSHVILKCLEKDVEKRYHSAAELKVELENIEKDIPTTKRVIPERKPTASKEITVTFGLKKLVIPAVVTLIILVAAILTYLLLGTKKKVLHFIHPVQITSAVGVEDYPTWSPESDRLAYQSNRSGNWDIWVTQVDGGSAVNRTEDNTGIDMLPSWSPDGRQIAFWSDRDDGGYFVMSALAGTPRKVKSVSQLMWSPPQWSTQGTELACMVRDATGFFIDILSLSTGDSRRLPIQGRKGNICFDLKWSPNGRYFAYVDAWNVTPDATQIWLLHIKSGDCFPITDGRFNDWSPSWSPDAKYLYFVSNREGSMDLWQLQIGEDGRPVDSPQPVTTGIGIRHALISQDGMKLAYSKGRLVANLWRVPIKQNRQATWVDAQQVTFDQAFIEFVDVSPDGKRLVFSSDRGGNQDLWMMPLEGAEMQQVTTDPAPDWAPDVSPDGKAIVFYSARSGNRDIWLMPIGGGPLRQLTKDVESDVGPVWSPDGQQVAFTSGRRGNLDIWVIPTEGGEAKAVTMDTGEDAWASWSSDGNWLVFRSDRTGSSCLWRAPAGGGRPELLTEVGVSYPRWSPDGRKVYFIGAGESAGNLWELSVKDGAVRQVTDLKGKRGSLGSYALATDGRHLFFTWEEDIGDLWAMDSSTEK
jgi:Tol biopolymer transport system component/tRNA A-37 threonylcarbamoyl transferase component Bud32